MDANFDTIINSNFQPVSTTTDGGSAVVFSFNSSFDNNAKAAIEEILDLIDTRGFTTEYPIDSIELHKQLLDILKKNFGGGNVNYTESK